MSQFFANIVSQIAGLAGEFWQNLLYSNVSLWQAVLDIGIVAVVFYFLFSLLKGSRSINVMIGLIVISIFFLISKGLNLLTVGWILDRFFTLILVAIPIIFQQELRMALEKLGHNPFLAGERKVALDALVTEIVESCELMVEKGVGALIVFRHNIALKEYVDTGVKMDAEVSKELLISIFVGKGPLHDGAIIIENGKILAAACVLPTSFDNKDKNLGTRHKAAIGLTDHTDASVVVISEEKGSIGFAKNGRLEKNIDLARLEQLLKIVLAPKSNKKKKEKKMIYREE